ncbi:hypothetical protein J6590_025907 [Homalodisca vitripennis]|nr:hypothetical protein J6590_025907 [Homalodisca vitripennis]
MVLTTVEKVFIVEYYFRSYGIGRAGGPSLLYTALRFQKHLHKNPPSNALILSVVEQFRRTGSVLTQRKGFSGRVLQQVLQSPKRSLMRASLKLNISKTSILRTRSLQCLRPPKSVRQYQGIRGRRCYRVARPHDLYSLTDQRPQLHASPLTLQKFATHNPATSNMMRRECKVSKSTYCGNEIVHTNSARKKCILYQATCSLRGSPQYLNQSDSIRVSEAGDVIMWQKRTICIHY